jgi:hypothetical protein
MSDPSNDIEIIENIDNIDNSDAIDDVSNKISAGEIYDDGTEHSMMLTNDEIIDKFAKKNKKKYENNCNNCNKLFKTEKSFLRHEKLQLCYNQLKRTYCDACDISYDTRKEYEVHMISLAHITKLKAISGYIETIEVNEVPTINTADPYLNENDIKTINNKNNIGFTINFKNSKVQTVNIVAKKPQNKSPTNQITSTDSTGLVKQSQQPTAQPLQQQSQQNREVIQIIPSQRQAKILLFLEKLKDVNTCGTKLMEILDNKLHIDDYRNLQSLISQSKIINSSMKQIYVETINKFTMALVKLKNKGTTIYNDKDIATLVMNLTS